MAMRERGVAKGRPLTISSQLPISVGGELLEATVVRSSRRKRTVAVSVTAAGLRVLAPARTTDEQITTLLGQRAAWIALRLDSVRSAIPALLETGTTLAFRGEALRVRIATGHMARTSVTLHGDELTILVPGGLAEDTRRDAVRAAITRWYRARAAELLPLVVDRWARSSGLNPARVLVRDQRRRWGSCAPDGTIRLNWRLVMLEPGLMDYVVCHELAHLRHRHHQPAFWQEVATLIPDHRERRKRLNAVAASTHLLD